MYNVLWSYSSLLFLHCISFSNSCSLFQKKIYLTDPLSPVNAAQMYIAKESSSAVWATYHCPHTKKSDSPSPGNHELTKALQLEVRPQWPLPHPCWKFYMTRSWAGLTQAAIAAVSLCWQQPCHIQKTFHSPHPCLQLLHYVCSWLCDVLRYLVQGKTAGQHTCLTHTWYP